MYDLNLINLKYLFKNIFEIKSFIMLIVYLMIRLILMLIDGKINFTIFTTIRKILFKYHEYFQMI